MCGVHGVGLCVTSMFVCGVCVVCMVRVCIRVACVFVGQSMVCVMCVNVVFVWCVWGVCGVYVECVCSVCM